MALSKLIKTNETYERGNLLLRGESEKSNGHLRVKFVGKGYKILQLNFSLYMDGYIYSQTVSLSNVL